MIFFLVIGWLIYRHYYSPKQQPEPEQTQVVVAFDDCRAYAEMVKRRQAEEKQQQLERKQQLKRATAQQQIDNIYLLQDELFAYMTALNREEKAIETTVDGLNDEKQILVKRIAAIDNNPLKTVFTAEQNKRADNEKAEINRKIQSIEKQLASIAGKKTSIASKRASLSSRIANNENRIAKLKLEAI